MIEKGRVGPGELLVLDTLSGRLYQSFEIDNDLKRRHPYKEWMAKNSQTLVPAEQLSPQDQGVSEFNQALCCSTRSCSATAEKNLSK